MAQLQEHVTEPDNIYFLNSLFGDFQSGDLVRWPPIWGDGGYLGHTAFNTWYLNDDGTINLTSIRIDNRHRFDRNELLTNEVKNRNLAKREWFNKINNLGQSLIQWLYRCCWNRGFVHGDLTANNLMLPWTDWVNGEIIVIDWFQSLRYYDVEDENYGEDAYYEDLFRFLLDVFDVIDSLGKLIYTGHNYWQRMGENTIGWYELNFNNNGRQYNVYNLLYENIKQNEDEEDYQSILTTEENNQDLNDDINTIFNWLDYYDLAPERFQRGFNNNNNDMPNYYGGTSIKFGRQKRSKTKRNARSSKGRRVNKTKSLKLKNKKRHNSRRNIKKNSIKMAKKSRKKKVYYK